MRFSSFGKYNATGRLSVSKNKEAFAIKKEKWNSVVNKTPITYSTNREIGGVAPSKYLGKIEKKRQVDSTVLNDYLTSHWIDTVSIRKDDFDNHIITRAKMILDQIEKAIEKPISGRDSEEVIAAFGGSLDQIYALTGFFTTEYRRPGQAVRQQERKLQALLVQGDPA